MASYQVHLTCSTLVGAAYGSLAIWYWDFDWGTVLVGAGLTAIGGVLPDLDSDSGIPIRELFGLAATVSALILARRVFVSGAFTMEQSLAVMGGVYLFVRYCLSGLFKKLTVHRGMFHSIPAMFIAGLAIYLMYGSSNERIRIYLSVGVMFGFLSHLILDELYSVDFMGITLKLNKYAGSALKFYSKSWPATLTCYSTLIALAFVTLVEDGQSPQKVLNEVVQKVRQVNISGDKSGIQIRNYLGGTQ